jgi:chromosome segregation protein
LGEIAQELKSLGEVEEQANEEIEKARTELEQAKERGQEVMEEVRELSEQRHLAHKNLEEAERLAKDARSRMPQLREALSVHEVKRARAEETRQSAEERLSEEFDLTVEAAEAEAGKVEDLPAARSELKSLRGKLSQLSDVNLGAEAEWERLAERDRFLGEQKADLERARDNLREIIAEIDNATKVQFLEAFNAISQEFQRVFRYFFDGGSTQLVLTDPDNLLETGVDIVVKAPGRAKQPLAAMSGGERALTATSLLFAMLRVRPSPFCVLDEIDAALDEANTERLAALLRDWTDQTQFIVITHAPGTMQGCDRLYGVTMQERGVSCCLSIELEDAEDVLEGRPARSARDALFQSRESDGATVSETAS